jgi:hypothetical protein
MDRMFKKTGIVEIENVYCSCGEVIDKASSVCSKCNKELTKEYTTEKED